MWSRDCSEEGAYMRQQLRRRFWIEIAIAAASLGLLVLTMLWEEWIELLFGVSPDGGSGELEWAITSVVVVLTVASLVLARLEWRRAALSPA
jgi:hypothetical protein